jgi:ABC-type transport system involved in multi-copper enzyme maturation permease subunit
VLKELIAFEWRYHTRQPSFLGTAALFLLVGFGLTASGLGAANIAVSAPWLVTETLGVASLFSLFAIAIFAANAIVRDREHRSEEIIFTTPVPRLTFLLGRFGGAFAAAVTSFALAPIGMLIASRMPWLDAARVGPLNIAAYVCAFVTIGIPTLFFSTALLFAVAAMTRSALATYTASVFVYVLYLVCAALTGSPLMAGSGPGAGGGTLGALLDPFGLTAFFEVTRYWTIAERNHRFVALDGAMLANRLLWVAVAVAILFVVARTFSFRTRATKPPHRSFAVTFAALSARFAARDNKAVIPSVSEGPGRPGDARTEAVAPPYRRVEPRAGGTLAAFLSATRNEIAATMRSRPFLFLLALWFVLAFTTIRGDVFGAEYGAAFLPTTGLIVSTLQQPLSLIGLILIIYYGAELFWREQRYRFAAIVDATPVRGLTMVLSKWTALVTLLAVIIAVGIVAGVVVQLSGGYTNVQPLVYLSLFYFAGVPLALYAAAAIAVHSLSPGKYAGLVLVLLFIVATKNVDALGLEHPAWQFAAAPPVRYSEMRGFAGSARPFGRLMLQWSVVAAIFLAIAAPSWRRLNRGAGERLRRVRIDRGFAVLAIAALALTTGWVLRSTRFTSQNDLLDWKTDYEKHYRATAALPKPRIVAVSTRVDLFPDDDRVHIAGDYTLVNDSDAPIAAVDVTTPRADRRLSIEHVTFAPPLAPRARTKLHFDFTLDEVDTSAVMSSNTFPSLGYRLTAEISDPRERAKRGLGAASTPESDDEDVLSGDKSESQLVDFDAVVSTSAGETAITTGRLQREWTDGGRRHFHYRAEVPVRNRFAFASGHYAVAHRDVDGVDLSVAHAQQHAANVGAMLDAGARTIRYCNREFGAYPHRQLALVEVPSWWSFGGLAFPGVVLLSESRAFLVDARDSARPDLVARRVAHEVAHQWWGYRVIAASRAGALTITESLAKYTELRILDQMHGPDAVRNILAYELDRYLAGRAREPQKERTLAAAGDQAYLYYSKGALVMNAIRDLIGEAALNRALRTLTTIESPSTADLLSALRTVSNDAQFALIADWLQKIVLYDFRLDAVQVTPLPNGRFRVVAEVHAARYEASPDGREHEIPLDEIIDVGPVKARLRSGVNRVEFLGSSEILGVPRRGDVVVDPNFLRIDRTPADNRKTLDR